MKKDISHIKNLSASNFKALYEENLGSISSRYNRKLLERKLAYRLQEIQAGSLSKETQTQLELLIKKYDPINRQGLKSKGQSTAGRDARLPMPGSFITKIYKRKTIEVKVLESGFEFEGMHYKNLSHVANAVTGAHWNGFVFFGLTNGKRKAKD